MPFYDYECDTCKQVKEFKFMVADRPEDMNCWCGGTMRQIISCPASIGKNNMRKLNKWAYAQESGGTETVG